MPQTFFPAKAGRQIEVGDVCYFSGRSYTITGFKPHPGLREHTARIAESGDFSITIFDADILHACATHRWYSFHSCQH